MKNFLLLILFAFSISLNAQDINRIEEYEPGKEMMLGQVNVHGIQSNFDWWDKNYNAYLPNENIIDTFKDDLKGYTIKVFLGTWCGDSKRNVPRFFNILDKAGYNTNSVEIIALDKRDGAYKQAPNHEEQGLNIHRVPTFIFYKDGKQVNRIVERPNETLERDIKTILERKQKAISYYLTADYMSKLLNDTSSEDLDTLNDTIDLYRNYFADYVHGPKELNTLGHVYFDAGQMDKAEFIFKLNEKMFPYKDRVYGSLGEFYTKKENIYKAITNYYKALSLNPENEHYKEEIKTLEALAKKKAEEKKKSQK